LLAGVDWVSGLLELLDRISDAGKRIGRKPHVDDLQQPALLLSTYPLVPALVR
jgi:hypothetical protein